MLDELSSKWHHIFHLFDDCYNNVQDKPTWDDFSAEFADCPPHLLEHRINDLLGEALYQAIQQKQDNRATGLDDWRVAELKLLPLPIVQLFAAVLSRIELTGRWPRCMTEVPLSYLKKDGEARALP